MTKRERLSKLAAWDLQQLERDGKLPSVRRWSWRTALADAAFWLGYGGVLGLIAYVAFCAPR